jgi:rare lipoprotein A
MQRLLTTRHSSLVNCRWFALLGLLALAACSSAPTREEPATRKPGGYYLDDGPLANPPKDLDKVPDAQPKLEPVKASTARPYTVMGRTYTPIAQLGSYKAVGTASWYGKRYHGQPTASGEIYDMYGMTAAHPTLPIPSYARVTSLKSNRSVIVRINDRGPFHSDRIIDLSYTAAYKLGILTYGSSLVEVESLLPGETTTAVAIAMPERSSGSAAPVESSDRPLGASSQGPAPNAVSASSSVARADPAPPLTQEAPGVYVQLGAFSLAENARSFLVRLQADLGWISDVTGIYRRDGVYRVQAGPYTDRSEALRVASRIEQALELKPVLINR